MLKEFLQVSVLKVTFESVFYVKSVSQNILRYLWAYWCSDAKGALKTEIERERERFDHQGKETR